MIFNQLPAEILRLRIMVDSGIAITYTSLKSIWHPLLILSSSEKENLIGSKKKKGFSDRVKIICSKK